MRQKLGAALLPLIDGTDLLPLTRGVWLHIYALASPSSVVNAADALHRTPMLYIKRLPLSVVRAADLLLGCR